MAAVRLPTHEETVVEAAKYCGQNLANELKCLPGHNRSHNETEAAALKGGTFLDDCLLTQAWARVCRKSGWTDEEHWGYPFAVDAYYDRMEGKS